MAKRNLARGGIEMAVRGKGIALVGYGIGSELNKVGIVNVQGGCYFTPDNNSLFYCFRSKLRIMLDFK